MQQPKRRSKQQPKQPLLRQQRSKQPKQQLQQPKRLQQLGSQQLVLLVLEQLLELLQLEQQLELLLFCKRSEPGPAGRRSAKIFSWVFLN
jgi:hypothetical protein